MRVCVHAHMWVYVPRTVKMIPGVNGRDIIHVRTAELGTGMGMCMCVCAGIIRHNI